MTRRFIDTATVLKYLEDNPGATALEINAYMGTTINGIRSKLQKMWLAGEIDRVRQVNGAYRFTRRAAQAWGSTNQSYLNQLLSGVKRQGVSL